MLVKILVKIVHKYYFYDKKTKFLGKDGKIDQNRC